MFAAFLLPPLLLDRLRVPGLVGVLLAGAVLGPAGLGVLERSTPVTLLGSAGLYVLMFMAGLELDTDVLRRHRTPTVVFGLATFFFPITLGLVLFWWMGYGGLATILIASMFASHTLLAYPIASRLGLARTAPVAMTVGGTLITDTAALLVLGVVAAAHGGALTLQFWGWLVVSLLALAGWTSLVLPRASRWFFARAKSSEASDFLFVLVALFSTVAITHSLGIEPILGAFFAGTVLGRHLPEGSALSQRVQFVGTSFFLPFFLLSVGMLLDVRVLFSGTEMWEVAAAMLVATLGGKWLAAWLASRLFGMSTAATTMVFGLSVTQAAATLAATLVGFELGLLGEREISAVMVLILVTCVISPPLVQLAGRTLARERPSEPTTGVMSRVLVPLANPHNAPALLDLARWLRGGSAVEPVTGVVVVASSLSEAAPAVERAHQMLALAAAHAQSAALPVDLVTTIELDPARGILRTAAERRATTIVLGWDALLPNDSETRLGRVLDAVVDQSWQQIHLCHFVRPLRAHSRLLVVLPAQMQFLGGLSDVLVALGRLREGLRLSTHIVLLDAVADDFWRSVVPQSWGTPQWSEVSTTPAMPMNLAALTRPDDLVVVLGARRDSAAWERQLAVLPSALAKSGGASLMLVFPREHPDASALTTSVVRESTEVP